MFDVFAMDPYSPDVIWVVVVGFLFAALMAFGLGANDVANSFGTSVGSKVLTVRNACIVASVMEISGALLLGSKVSDTMRKGILDVTTYEGAEKELMIGSMSSLIGASIWLIIATLLKFPISATHSVVGATVGFSLVARGSQGIHWGTLGSIVASWFISPILSGVISIVIYLLIKYFILNSPSPLVPGLRALPFIYAITILVNAFSVIFEGPSVLYFDKLNWWQALIASTILSLIVGVCVHFFLSPRLRRRCEKYKNAVLEAETKQAEELGQTNEGFIRSESCDQPPNYDKMTHTTEQPLNVNKLETELNDVLAYGISTETAIPPVNNVNGGIANGGLANGGLANGGLANGGLANGGLANGSVAWTEKTYGSEADIRDIANIESNAPEAPVVTGIHSRADDPLEVVQLFTFLQILTATFCSFVHGGNDVSNAIGPLTAIWLIYTEGAVEQKTQTPYWVLLFGGLGITVGLWAWGRKVMKTIGTDLSKIVPSTGFAIELGAATTVLVASKFGIPVSTTHCLVGSVVFVGWVSASKEGVNWKLFRNIVFAWFVTLPISGGISALVMYIMEVTVI